METPTIMIFAFPFAKDKIHDSISMTWEKNRPNREKKNIIIKRERCQIYSPSLVVLETQRKSLVSLM